MVRQRESVSHGKSVVTGVRLILHWLLSNCDLGPINESLLESFVCTMEMLKDETMFSDFLIA